MKIVQTRAFSKVAKKLHSTRKKQLDQAINTINKNPQIDDLKIGDLVGHRVNRFKVKAEIYLIGYRVDDELTLLSLIALGTHENFYRNMKRNI